MEIGNLQMAIVAKATKIYKCKRAAARQGRAGRQGNGSEAAEGRRQCSVGASMSLRSRGGESDGAELPTDRSGRMLPSPAALPCPASLPLPPTLEDSELSHNHL